MIIDNNILIYLSKYILSPQSVITSNSALSIITKIEVLGFKFSKPDEHELLSAICQQLDTIPLTDEIAEKAIRLRSDYKIKLADAIIYAIAAIENKPLLTNNIAAFTLLDNQVKLVNPFTII